MTHVDINRLEDALRLSIENEIKAFKSYTLFAKKAEEEGYILVARVFRAIAQSEKLHASYFWRLLYDREMEDSDLEKIYNSVTVNVGSTIENLKACINNEGLESEEIYPKFADLALESNNPGAYMFFKQTSLVEKSHREVFLFLLKTIEEKSNLNDLNIYLCPQCGYISLGNRPHKCPICNEPGKNFILF